MARNTPTPLPLFMFSYWLLIKIILQTYSFLPLNFAVRRKHKIKFTDLSNQQRKEEKKYYAHTCIQKLYQSQEFPFQLLFIIDCTCYLIEDLSRKKLVLNLMGCYCKILLLHINNHLIMDIVLGEPLIVETNKKNAMVISTEK